MTLRIFARAALRRLPFGLADVAITRALQEKESKTERADFFLGLLRDHYPEEEARLQFETAVDWGRYAELFEFDADEESLSLHEGA